MNLFRSEEHARNWSGFKANTDGGIISLPDMVEAFSGSFFKRRLDPDYFSHMQAYLMESAGTWKKMGSFWTL